MSAVGYKSQYSVYDRFLNSMHTEATRHTYTKALKQFLTFSKFESYDDLIHKLSEDEKHELISDYITFLKNKRHNSIATMKIAFTTIKKFYRMNRVQLDWDYLAQFKGRNKGRKIDDRLYTKQEIEQMLIHADLREKVIIHCLLSTGMRVGGLAEIRYKDMTWIPEYNLYKFKVYADSEDTDDRYITFCTPECASIIDKYLEWRELRGDKIKPNSPLVYRKVTRFDNRKGVKKCIYTDLFDVLLDSDGVQQIVTRLRRKSMVAVLEKDDPENPGRIRKEMMNCHAFRKQFNTICIKNNMNHSVKEKLMGHKKEQELDFNYNRMNDEDLLNEYLYVVNDLTISDESRLKIQVKDLKSQLEDFHNNLGIKIDEYLNRKKGN